MLEHDKQEHLVKSQFSKRPYENLWIMRFISGEKIPMVRRIEQKISRSGIQIRVAVDNMQVISATIDEREII